MTLRLLWERQELKERCRHPVCQSKTKAVGVRRSWTAKSIVDARVGYDEIGEIVVCNMTMNGEGAGIWGQMTKAAAADNNRAVAVVLDNLGVLRTQRQQRHPERPVTNQLWHRTNRRAEAAWRRKTLPAC